MKNGEIRNVTWGKVMHCLICDREDFVVDSELYRQWRVARRRIMWNRRLVNSLAATVSNLKKLD